MTHAEAVAVVQQAVVNVDTGHPVFIQPDGALRAALLVLVDEDARHHTHREPRKPRGYHDADGWPVKVR